MFEWKEWAKEQPENGTKIVVLCDDGCSCSICYYIDGQLLDAEDGYDLSTLFIRGSLWAPIPQDYPIRFMEVTEDDWY